MVPTERRMTQTDEEAHDRRPDGTGDPRPGSRFPAGAGIAIGVGVGAALGVALDNIAVGVAIGAGVGTVFELAFRNTRTRGDG